jgi:hypothetical protein
VGALRLADDQQDSAYPEALSASLAGSCTPLDDKAAAFTELSLASALLAVIGELGSETPTEWISP